MGAVAAGAKRRHFDDVPPEAHVRKTKSPADQARIAKQPPDFLRMRVRRDIEVFRVQPEQQITDSAANQKGLVAGLMQTVQNLERVLADV